MNGIVNNISRDVSQNSRKTKYFLLWYVFDTLTTLFDGYTKIGKNKK